MQILWGLSGTDELGVYFNLRWYFYCFMFDKLKGNVTNSFKMGWRWGGTPVCWSYPATNQAQDQSPTQNLCKKSIVVWYKGAYCLRFQDIIVTVAFLMPTRQTSTSICKRSWRSSWSKLQMDTYFEVCEASLVYIQVPESQAPAYFYKAIEDDMDSYVNQVCMMIQSDEVEKKIPFPTIGQ